MIAIAYSVSKTKGIVIPDNFTTRWSGKPKYLKQRPAPRKELVFVDYVVNFWVP